MAKLTVYLPDDILPTDMAFELQELQPDDRPHRTRVLDAAAAITIHLSEKAGILTLPEAEAGS